VSTENSGTPGPNPADTYVVKNKMSGVPGLVLGTIALVISIVGLSLLLILFLVTHHSTLSFFSDSSVEEIAEDTASQDGTTGAGDLYAPPENLGRLIDQVRASTVTILCKDSQGSGWVVSLDGFGDDASEEDLALDRKYPNEVITNHHVIEECVDEPTSVRARAGAEEYDAYLYSWDEENDLALVAITQDVPFLEVSKQPEPGWWAMAVGTPYGLEGSVSIGNVMNIEDFEVYSTSPLNSGNSGGPMVNSRGEVMGTSTATRIGEEDPQDWNIAVGSPALCVEVVLCEGDDTEFFWD
jgi:S1-C subfamily serine protease